MDVAGFVLALIGIAAGGLITFFASRFYYQKASEELKKESVLLRQETERAKEYVDALISFLEAAQQISRIPREAETGKPLKTQFIDVGHSIESEEAFGGASVGRRDPTTSQDEQAPKGLESDSPDPRD